MKVKDLMVGYPIYHIEGHIEYFCDGNVITSLDKIGYDRYEIGYRNVDRNTYGVVFANGDDNVQLTHEPLSKGKKRLMRLKAWWNKFKM